MKVTKTKPKCLLVLILTFSITAVQSEASSHDEDLRVLIVGDERGVRYSTEVLLGKKESRQMNNTVIMDDGQRMMVVSGPNPCFKNTEESFKTALLLSSPGPHAVLMALDPESEQCDLLKHLHESLRSDVLQYCIVLLFQQHHPEKAEDTTVVKARKMINTCGGRFHRITDPRPALIAEINKLLWLNEGNFYSLELFNTSQVKKQTHRRSDEDAAEEVNLFTVICQTLVTAAVVGFSYMLLVTFLLGILSGDLLIFWSGFVVLIVIEVTLRNNLRPEVSIPLNLVLMPPIIAIIMNGRKSETSESSKISQILKDIGNTLLCFICIPLVFYSNTAVCVFTCIRSWSDVIIMCHTTLGITVSIIKLSFFNDIITFMMKHRGPLDEMFVFFLCCMAGMTLLIGFVTLLNQIDIKITTTLYILGLTMAYLYFKG